MEGNTIHTNSNQKSTTATLPVVDSAKGRMMASRYVVGGGGGGGGGGWGGVLAALPI